MVARFLSCGAALALFVSPAVASTCLMDQPDEALVEELLAHASDQSRFRPKANIRRAVLAEKAIPGTAEVLLEFPVGKDVNGDKYDLLLPSVLRLADGDWDAAIEAVPQSENFDTRKAAEAVFPLTVEFSGDYARLLDLYPLGEGTFLQNLNLWHAVRVALDGRKPELVASIFASHRFGPHSGSHYERTMRALLDQGERGEARRLGGVLSAGIESHDAEGGLSLCLEVKPIDRCRDELLRRRDMARLERFDGAAFASCLQHAENGEAPATCFNNLKALADEAGFDMEAADPRVPGYIGLESWMIDVFSASMGSLNPMDIPANAFRDPDDYHALKMHGLTMAALLYLGERAVHDAYQKHLLAAVPPWKSKMMERDTGRSWEDDVELSSKFAFVDVLFWNEEKALLQEMAANPDLDEEVRESANRRLFALHRRSGRVESAVDTGRELKLEPQKLLAYSHAHKAAGEMAMADALEGLVRESVCDENLPLKQYQRRQMIDRLLMERIVESGKAPKTLLFH